jgi:hypothetical protein
MSNQSNGDFLPPHKNPQLAECHGDLLPDLNQSVWDLLLHTATQHSEKNAVISLWQPASHLSNLVGKKAQVRLTARSKSDEYFCWTYEELAEAAELLAGYLQSRGCLEGENLVRHCNRKSLHWNSHH